MYKNNTYSLTPEILIQAIKGEQDAIKFYEKLILMTSDAQNIEFIRGIIDDEKKHLNMFSDLYLRLTKHLPKLPLPKVPQISSFISGVKQSITDELDAYEFYRNIYLANYDNLVQHIFFEALTDENEHAQKFNFMFTKSFE